jgi:hypothetical protein
MKKQVNNLAEIVPQDEVARRLGLGAVDKVWMVTKLVLAFVDKYGEEGWEIYKKMIDDRCERKVLWMKKQMEKDGANFNDPRDIIKYSREYGGFWGYVEHTVDNVSVKPDGKVRVEYRITKCMLPEAWNEMGLSKEVQFKLDSIWGYLGDVGVLKQFDIKYECDQGLPQGRPYCKFVLEKL